MGVPADRFDGVFNDDTKNIVEPSVVDHRAMVDPASDQNLRPQPEDYRDDRLVIFSLDDLLSGRDFDIEFIPNSDIMSDYNTESIFIDLSRESDAYENH